MEPRQLKELEMMARTEETFPEAEPASLRNHLRRGNGVTPKQEIAAATIQAVSGVSKPKGRIRPDPVNHDQRPGYDMMGVFHRHSHLLSFLALLVFCSVMVVYQYRRNQSRHVEIREAFILLYTKGYRDKADRLYNHLVQDVSALSIRTLEDDWSMLRRALQLAGEEK